jgi:bifunctional UDP-N-acetylglucosamine pyrophosphorylase/glucosamine-1-phosphate N-acetyltransferase
VTENKKIKIVILAGGKGKRMQSDLPKALVQVNGKAMIKHLLESIEKSGVCEIPSIVVGYGKESVMKELGEKYHYTHQEEQLGTGHAVMCTHKDLKDKTDHVLVLYADNPFMKPETIKKLADKHLTSKAKLTMATVKLPDFEDWRNFFYKNFSRIIRNEKGEIIKSVEFRDASEEEKKVKEVNPCYFCFDADWLWKKLQTLKNDNAQKEYYLTDLVKIAMEEGLKIESISIDPQEALAANSKEELEILEKFAKK